MLNVYLFYLFELIYLFIGLIRLWRLLERIKDPMRYRWGIGWSIYDCGSLCSYLPMGNDDPCLGRIFCSLNNDVCVRVWNCGTLGSIFWAFISLTKEYNHNRMAPGQDQNRQSSNKPNKSKQTIWSIQLKP